uniref:Uncharacterized protein n=1 Tax=Nelumbo nucifera TaxID=4432 RepID=A0A822ZJX0_NELNU|nr:TPA_asm: hypothetical protein HUJ06_001536 [Nelumbo nucifera]
MATVVILRQPPSRFHLRGHVLAFNRYVVALCHLCGRGDSSSTCQPLASGTLAPGANMSCSVGVTSHVPFSGWGALAAFRGLRRSVSLALCFSFFLSGPHRFLDFLTTAHIRTSNSLVRLLRLRE